MIGQTAQGVIAVGANVLVAGSAVFRTADYAANIASIRTSATSAHDITV